MPQIFQCEPERLEQMLDGTLAEGDEEQLLIHLDHCPLCRQQLEHLAAIPDAWNQASQYLQDDLLDESTIDQASCDQEASVALPSLVSQVIRMLQPSDDPEMLGRIGPFEVKGVVGAGGMGVVLKALDRALDRVVAIKVMAPYLASSGAARQRFAREARAAAAVIHPNVIAIHSVATDASLPYLVMSYIAGSSLQNRIDQDGPLPLADILRVGVQIAAGLAAAHGQGLVHRDIKPANMLLEHGVDRLVITDFGLARTVDDAAMTRTGVIAGTPQYMSPEQARGEALDARSDLFSLGSVLYAACTGRAPFRAETSLAVLRRITDDVARPIQEINPSVPVWLSDVVDRLHNKLPQNRFQTATEVSELLTRCLAHVTGPIEHPLPDELLRSRTTHRSRKGLRYVFVACGLVALSIAAWQLPLVLQVSHDDNLLSGQVSTSAPKPKVEPEAPPDSNQISVPWDSPETHLHQWNDNLNPVFEHIEQSLRRLKPNSSTNPLFGD